MSSSKKYLVLFDLDRTIFSINSGNILVREAYKHKLMSGKEFLKAAYLGISYRLESRDPMIILEELAGWMKDVSVPELDVLAKKIIEKYLLPKIRPGIYQEIEKHKKNGASVGILSAALPLICKPIASHLGLEDIICSEIEIKDDKYTGKVLAKLCYAEQKAIRLNDYCQQLGFNLKETFYYADSITDRHALEAVGHPVCVEPDRRLRKLAKKNNWQIAEWV